MRKVTSILFTIVTAFFTAQAFASAAPTDGNVVKVSAKWNEIGRVSETVPTTQLLAHAYTLRSNPLHTTLLKAVRNLHSNDTRLQFWYSVTNQAVPELKEPTATDTSWNFQNIDPLVSDFFSNTSGKRHVNIGTIPRWMFDVPRVEIPSDPAASFYPYTDGTKGDLLKDPTGQQIAEYQARIYQWFTQGGFTDEIGKYHKSGHHYKIDYWGILNEPDIENKISVEEYTRIYDAVAAAIHKIDPNVQFFGPEVAGAVVPWADYFLNPKNHSPDALPVQWFSFHNYVEANNDPATWQVRFFTGPPPTSNAGGASARAFVDRVRQVIKIRDELSPKTKVIIDELGTFNIVKPGEDACQAPEPYLAYNPRYWNAIGANWAVNFISAENLGIPVIGMSQMLGYPTQCPSISMVNSDTANPNAHYWALKLINDNFGPGDKLASTQSSSSDIVAQASITSHGRKVLLVNTSNETVTVDLANTFQGSGLAVELVDQVSGEHPQRNVRVKGPQLSLGPFAIAVVREGAN
jgi:hypothetical protein